MAQPKKTGLGKGLDALFGGVSINEQPQETVVEEKNEINDNLKSLKITEVEPNRDQPRKQFKQEALEDLAESIKTYGIIQPIVVTKQDGYYGIVAGERRWRAAKKGGLTEMPCLVRTKTEQENREIALIENIQRENLNPIEKARGLRRLLDDYGLSQQQLADKLGMSRSGLTNNVRILNLDPRVIDLVLEEFNDSVIRYGVRNNTDYTTLEILLNIIYDKLITINYDDDINCYSRVLCF